MVTRFDFAVEVILVSSGTTTAKARKNLCLYHCFLLSV
jgi:hypothetical protein